MPRLQHAVATLAALALASATAGAQANTSCAEGERPTVLTVEGGGSLGVYEAGMTYAFVELFKRKRADTTNAYKDYPALCLAVATGASAGNINSFLASTEWCTRTVSASPEESLFWKTWVSTGLTQLFPARGDTGDAEGGLFSRRHFRGYLRKTLTAEWARVRAEWIPGCHVQFGATVTRLLADTVPGAGSLTARNQRLAFAFTVAGIKDDGTPVMTPFVPRPQHYSFGKVATLPPAADALVSWDDAFRLVETSSSYPVAFQPLPIPYCTRFSSRTRADSLRPASCTTSTNAIALDGGVFDNGPIALAYSLFFEQGGRDIPIAVYLSPDQRRLWARQLPDITIAPRDKKPTPDAYGLESVTQLAREAFPTARQYELQFAGRLLPAELLRRGTQDELAFHRTASDSLRTLLQLQIGFNRRQADSLKFAVARVCAEWKALDSLAVMPTDCALAFASLDSATRGEIQQQGRTARPVSPSRIPPAGANPSDDTALLEASKSLNDRFHSTARWHPLAGDWLSGFGAFFGRPLREYDFYVGIYDAFALVAEHVPCRDERQQRGGSYDFQDCLKRHLGASVGRPPIPIGAVASGILRQLYRDEFGEDPPGSPPPAANALDSTNLLVATAIRGAMFTARMGTADPYAKLQRGAKARLRETISRGHCRHTGMFDKMYCESGVVAFFDQLRKRDSAVRVLKRWRDHPKCDERHWDEPDACRVERRFVRMIDDPEGSLFVFTGQALARLERVTPDTAPSRAIAGIIVFLHGSTADHHRRGWDLGASSLGFDMDPWPRRIMHLVPTSVSLTPNTAGWGDWGWEVRRHLGASKFALTLPLHVRPRAEIGADDAGKRYTLVIPGLRFENTALPLNSRAGVQMDAWFRPGIEGEDTYAGRTIGVFASIGGKINVSLTGVPPELRRFRQTTRMRPFGEPAVFNLGIGDLNGMLYWSARLIKGAW